LGVRFASDRLGSFMTGEKKLAGTNTPPRVRGRHAVGGEGVRHACQRGPQRVPAAKPAATQQREAEGEQRRRGRAILHGDDPEPLKLDCPYCFTVQEHEDGTVTVRINEAVLVAGHNHDGARPQKFVSPWVEDVIKDYYSRNPKVTAKYLVEELAAVAEDFAAVESMFDSFDETLDAYGKGKIRVERDAFVDAKYIGGVLRKLRRAKSGVVLSDEGEDIKRWVEEHYEDVTIYQPGEPVAEGEAEDVRARVRERFFVAVPSVVAVL
jgi:hypothetical protein